MRAIRLFYGLALIGMTACAEPAQTPRPGASLRDVTIPSDFTFQTSRTQRLQLMPEDGAFGATAKDAPVVVSRPDGAVLYRGAVKKGVALDVEVSVPTAVNAVDVAIGKQRASIELGGQAGQ